MKRWWTAALVCVCAAPAFAGYGLLWSVSGFHEWAHFRTGNPTVNLDVNADGHPDVLMDADQGLKIYSGVTHSLIWDLSTYPDTVYYGRECYGPGLFVGEMDVDGNSEIALCIGLAGGPTNQSAFQVYDCVTHDLEFETPLADDAVWGCADLDGDGRDEIAVVGGGASDRTLYVYGWTSGGTDEQGAAPEPAGTTVPSLVRQEARFRVSLAGQGRTDVLVSNAAGRVVRTVQIDGRPGINAVTWDCRDSNGEPVPAGKYFYRCGQSAGNVEVIR